MKKTKLMLGDNITSLRKLPDNSIDSIVTDPPYGLSFMGKKWDYDVPSVEFWKEVWRVLKPGGHILSFGGTRTYHRMVVNIEDAGFEIRDQIQWIYASGFPKSLNIQKQFEKNGYKVCECSEQNTEYDLRQMPEANISQTINSENKQGEALLSQLPKQDIQISEHTASDVWREQSSLEGGSNTIQEEGKLQRNNIQESTRTSKRHGEEGWIHNGAQNDNGSNGEKIIDENRSGSSQRPQSEQQSFEQSGTMADKCRPQKSGSGKICGRCGEQIIDVKGFGTALKPANEPICLARKPLSEKSVAENVLKWRTGGINVDVCRVGTESITIRGGGYEDWGGKGLKANINLVSEGRFPANIILDEIAGEILDEQSGISKSNCKSGVVEGKDANVFNDGEKKTSGHKKKVMVGDYNDKGGASRYFQQIKTTDDEHETNLRFVYQAKVSKKERNMGLDESIKSNHPTMKPVSLMAYLCRLITPPNGIILDPFMGSGSTGIAAQLEGFKFCGMEMDADYFKIAESRIESYEKYREFIK